MICGTRHQKALVRKAASFSVRCEQSSKGGNGLDVWLGRTAMIGFAVAISVEISTGKGLLEVWHAWKLLLLIICVCFYLPNS